MSYARVGSSGCYIYADNDGIIYFDGEYVKSDIVDIFLYKLSEYRPEELKQRVEHGKQLCDDWIKDVVEAETNNE